MWLEAIIGRPLTRKETEEIEAMYRAHPNHAEYLERLAEEDRST
jgi:hypothetical protein